MRAVIIVTVNYIYGKQLLMSTITAQNSGQERKRPEERCKIRCSFPQAQNLKFRQTYKVRR